ncbi:hypothetical protein NDU88_003648 [Pleurodeles waltl]|uniref:Uncharacterized protein n=1 Tax=Pleurodeles waltl TaxID=8319 RepID=A0AAV7SGJ2_PLEWA|nr:hypothetical protein NDU88_003648 [Pleurodeles waltl]
MAAPAWVKVQPGTGRMAVPAWVKAHPWTGCVAAWVKAHPGTSCLAQTASHDHLLPQAQVGPLATPILWGQQEPSPRLTATEGGEAGCQRQCENTPWIQMAWGGWRPRRSEGDRCHPLTPGGAEKDKKTRLHLVQ